MQTSVSSNNARSLTISSTIRMFHRPSCSTNRAVRRLKRGPRCMCCVRACGGKVISRAAIVHCCRLCLTRFDPIERNAACAWKATRLCYVPIQVFQSINAVALTRHNTRLLELRPPALTKTPHGLPCSTAGITRRFEFRYEVDLPRPVRVSQNVHCRTLEEQAHQDSVVNL